MKRGNRWSAIGVKRALRGENGMERTTEAKRCLYGDDARGLFSGWFWLVVTERQIYTHT